MKNLGLAILMAVFAVGCAKAKSSGIATSEIYGSFYVTGDSSGTVVCSATLYVGGPTGTYIELDGEDKLECSDGTATVTMTSESSIIGSVSYVANSGLTYDTTRTYTVSFKRKAGEVHPGSVTLPTAVTILTPAADSQATKGAALTTTWTPGSGTSVDATLSWQSGSSSGSSTKASNSDSGGTATFLATETTTSTVTGNVNAKIKILRRGGGTHPSTLKGTTQGEQYKEVSIVLKD